MEHLSGNSKPTWRCLILQFRLRTILIAVSLTSLPLGFWASRISQQTSVINWIETNGGSAGYDYHWHGNGAFGLPTAPRWLTDITGLDPFASIHNVEFPNAQIENIEPLSRLPYLERVWLDHSSVSDISPLSKNDRLIELNIGGTSVSNFSPLKNHDNLLWLIVPDSVSIDKLEELRLWLPQCEIYRVSGPH